MHRGHAGHLGSFVGRADRQARRGTSVARGAAACCHGDAIAAWRTPPESFSEGSEKRTKALPSAVTGSSYAGATHQWDERGNVARISTHGSK